MNNFKDRFLSFFFRPVIDQQWIAFFRMSIGIVILLHLVAILPDFDLLFSTNGIIPNDIMNVFTPNYIITLPKIIYFFNGFGISKQIILLFFKILYILFSVFLIFGFFSRINAFLLLFLQISLVKGFSFYAYGGDFFMSMSLFYLILIPSSYQYSVMGFFRKKSKKINITPYLRLFQIHLSIVYFFSGFGKILGFNWWNGESIWKAINLPFSNLDFGFDFSFLGHHPLLLIIIGWMTIITEMCYPLFIWWKKTIKIWLCLTISMHLGIALVLNLYFFSAIMIIWNLTAFYFLPEKTKTKSVSTENKKSRIALT